MRFLLLAVLLACFYVPTFADTHYSPQTSNSVSGTGSYCQGASASPVTFTYNTCVSGAGGTAFGDAMTIYWYRNTVNSTTGGTLVATVSSNSATAGTGSVSYTPSTVNAGAFYYYCIISYSASGTCGTGGTLTSPSAVLVTVLAPPGPIIGATSVAPSATVTLSDSATNGTWTSSNTSVVTINSSTGAMRGVASGSATITYSTGCGTSVTTTVYVISAITWYQDSENDGWGNPLITASSASKPSGYVQNSQDANDINVNTSAWYNIGTAGFAFSGGSVNTTNNLIAYDNNNVPYVYYLLNTSNSWVQKYSGGAWSVVGGTSFTGNVPYASMAFNSANTLYVAYQDGYNASCKKFDGTNWVQVGSANFTANGATYESLAIDGADVPYMAYRDNNVSNKASVMKFNGTSWVQVGSAGFSAGGASYTTIATDLSNNLYVAYVDEANSSKVSVMKYNGSTWSTVGSVGFSAGSASYVSLAIDRTGIPYVAYNDGGNSNKATVMKFNGTSWVTVGTAGFSTGTANYTKIAVDAGGNIFVSYSDASYSNKAVVMKYNGSSWAAVVNSTGLTPGSASYVSIALNKEGVPGLFYQDGANSNKGSAMYLAPVKVMPTAPVITASPASSCSGTTVTLSVASGSLNDATAWIWYKGSCGGTYVGTGTTITLAVSSTTNFYCRGENSYFTTQGDCGYAKVTIKPTPTWYQDSDGDGWGNASVSISTCSQPTGYVLNNSDCTDASTTNTVAYNYGNPGISGSTATYTNLLFDNNNIPYLYFLNNNTSSSVYKYSSGTWTAVGSTGFTGNVSYGSMAINSTGNLYVAYQDGFQASCKRYNGTDWEQVGTTNFTPGGATYTSLAIDNSDVPYMAFVDAYYVYNGKASVMKYNGAAWSYVGGGGFTSGTANYTSLAVDAAGSLYVAYQDGANSSKATVMKYAAGAWSVLGSAGFSDGTAANIQIAVDGNGTPFVVYSDNNYSNKAIVKKYNGSSWVNLGLSTGISTGAATYNSIKLDAGGNPYISYTDNGISSKASVMKYNGTSWVSVSTAAGFTPAGSSHSSLALDANGIPYLSTQDGNTSNKATVYKAAPVSVNPTTPVVSGSSTSISCGTVITLTAAGTLNNATAWKWYTDTSGTATSIGSGATFTVAPTTTGVRYYARGEGPCLTNQGYFGSSSAITVSGGVTAPSDISGTSPICRAATTTFTSSGSGAWSTSNAAVASVNSSTGLVTGVSAGTATITYTVTVGGCGSTSKYKSITVVRPPSIITGTTTVCVNGLTSLADTVSGGAWSSSNTTVATVTSTTGVVSGATAGTTVISYTLTNACGTNIAVGATVTVNAPPTVGGISATPTGYCMGAGGAITLTATGSVTGAGTLTSYNWSGPLGYSTTSSTPSVSFTPTNTLSSGNYQLTVTYPGSACISSAVSSSYVTVSPNPTIYTVTGGTGCSYPGVTVGLSGSQTGISYQLYIGGVASGSPVAGTGSALNFGTKTAPGTYTISAIGSASCVASMTGSASVVTAPTLFTLNGGTACASTGVTISLSNSESGINYQLYRGAATVGSTIAGTGASLSFGFQNTVGNYYVVATGTGGCADTMNNRANVVNSLPAYNVTGGTGCTYTLGTTVGLDNSQSGVSYQLYNGIYTAGSPVTGTGSAINFGLQTTSGVYNVIASTTGCTSQNMTGSSTVYTSPSAYSVLGGTGCPSTGVSISLSGSASGVNYQLYNGAATVGSPVAGTGSSITFGTQTALGTYKIIGTATSGCTRSMSDSATVTNPSVTPTAITGTMSVCVGSQTTLSDASSGGIWSSSDNTIATVSSGGVVTGVSAGSVNISYAISSSCGYSAVTAAVTVNAQPTLSVSPATTLCGSSSTTLTATGASTYSWSPATNLSATTGTTVTASPTSSLTYTVTGTASGCSANRTISVTVNTVPTVASVTANSNNLCYGATLALTAGSVSGTGTPTYNWRGPNSYSTSSTASVATITVNTTSASGVYTLFVTYPGTGCTSANVVTTPSVNVTPLPSVAGVTSYTNTMCAGSVLTLTAGAVTAGSGTFTSYNWSGPNSYSATGTTGVNTLTPASAAASGAYSVAVVYSGTGCTSTVVATPSVTVNAVPTIANITPSSTALCYAGVLTLTAGTTTGAGSVASYNWRGPNSYSTSTAGTVNTASITASTTAQSGIYSVSVTYPGYGCTSTYASTPSVTVNAVPTVANIVASSYTVCAGTLVTLTAGTVTGGAGTLTAYNWSGPGSFSTSGTANIVAFTPTSTASTGVYSVNVQYSGTGCTSTNVVSPTINVNNLPTVPSITPSSFALCYGSSLSLTAGTPTGTGTLTSYNWRGPNSYSTSGTSNVASTTVNTTTASGYYSVSVTYPGTGCTSAYAITSSSVSVTPLPTVANITASTACVGSSLTLTAGAITGPGTITSYNWSGPNSYSTTSTTSPVAFSPTSTAYSGVYTLSVTYPGTGCRSTNVVTSPSVTVNGAIASGTISGSSTPLAGTTSTLVITGASGGTGAWSSSNTAIATVTTSGTATTLSAVSQGSVTITYSVTNPCGTTGYSIYSVTVQSQPTVSSVSPNIAIPGSSVSISGSNFNTNASNNIVYFGATKGIVTGASSTLLNVTVPTGATFQSVSVLNGATGLAGISTRAFLPTYDTTGLLTDSLNFRSPLNFATTSAASHPYTGAIGDVDGDGKPDLVVNNRDSNSLSIFINNGSTAGTLGASSFTLYSKLTTLGSPNNVKLADIDGDGKLDIVTAMSGANFMCVFRNTTSAAGIPTFATRTDVTVGTISSVAAVGDFNGDGMPDVALTLPAASAIGVLKNTSTVGSISFAAVVGITVGAVPSGVAVADLDGDGKMDIAAANSGFDGTATYNGSTASIARNTSTLSTISFGTSVSLSTGGGPIDIAAADMNNDGKPDLLVTNANDGTFSVLRNTATSGTLTTSSFAARVNFTSGSYATGIAVADLNGDKMPDVVESNVSGTISLFRNITTGTTPAFASKTDIADANGPTTVTIGDLDGDKYPDVVVGNQISNTISVIKNYPLPRVAPITGTSSICAGGGTASLSNATSGGYWSMAHSNATITSAGVVTGVTAGTDTAIYAVVVNYDTNYARLPLVINALPAITLGTNPTVCEDAGTASVSYSGATGSPTTYSINWNAGAVSAGFNNVVSGVLAGSPISFNLPAGLSGVYSGSIGVNNGCASASYPFSVTVYTHPTATISSAVAPCTGYAGNITISGTSGASINYSVDGGSPLTATLTGGTFTFSTGVITTTHDYTLINAHNTACTSIIGTIATVTPVLMQWVGGAPAHESEWNNASNWGCGAIPTVTDVAIIPAGTTYVPLVSAAPIANVKDLTIQSGASITLSNSAVLNVKGALLNNGSINGTGTLSISGTSAQLIKGKGTIAGLEIKNNSGVTIDTGALVVVTDVLTMTSGNLVTSDSLQLYSDIAGTARIAPIASGSAITGKVSVMQYIQGGFRRYRFLAHPFSDTISMLQIQKYIDITGSGGASSGFTTTGSNASSAFRYSALTSNSLLGYDPGWKPFSKINNSAADSNRFHPGQGIRIFCRGAKDEGLGYLGYYGMYTPSATTIKMSGHVNQGTKIIKLQQGSDAPTQQDYNMVGNPYASPVDIGAVVYNAQQNHQVTGGAFYLWNPTTGPSGQYIAVPISSVTPYYIQANTSFQVRADHNGAQLTFNETNKGAMSNQSLLKMSSDYVTLGIYDSENNLWDKMDIKFNDGATINEDKLLDAAKILGTDFGLYSIAGDGRKLTIDARPFDEENVIPLGITSAYNQSFTIKADNIALPEGGTLVLHDKLLQKFIPLTQGAEYKFDVSGDKATQGDSRFEIGMKPIQNTVENQLMIGLVPNPATDEVNVNFTSANKDRTTINIYDMNGVTVYNKDFGNQYAGSVKVPTSNFAAGVYTVEVVSGGQKKTRQLVKE